MLESKSVFAA